MLLSTDAGGPVMIQDFKNRTSFDGVSVQVTYPGWFGRESTETKCVPEDLSVRAQLN